MTTKAKTRSNLLATTHPEIAAQWHPTKNGDLTPDTVSYGSGIEVWWQCPSGHAWQAAITTRTCAKTGCPYCSGHRAIPGENDLATTDPDLAAQWHPTKNGNLTPSDVKRRSNKHVWWLCPEGHEWRAAIHSRSHGAGCPCCSGRKAIPGTNDLAATHPNLAAQWHPTKNGNLTPADVKRASGKEVWWLCPEGHAWQATVLSRHRGCNCPHCPPTKTRTTPTSLAVADQAIAAQWHPTKNGDLTPSNVTAGSDKKVWWQCPQGHEWEATVFARLHGGGCPYCSGRKVVTGINDLATLRPKLAAQWHPTKNGDLLPSQVARYSNKKVWWLGPCGHEWEATILSRSQGTSCPYCSGRKPIVGENDLATTDPDLAAQWHPTKNGSLTPSDVKRGSNRKVWWQCPKGHAWMKIVNIRSNGATCPVCAKKQSIKAPSWAHHPINTQNIKGA